MLRQIFYSRLQPLLNRVCARLAAWRVTPLALTLAGAAVTLGGAIFYIRHQYAWGSWIILIGSVFDMLDGALARQTGRTSDFGAFLDSLVDRFSDGFIFGGLMIGLASQGHEGLATVAGLVLLGAFATSYAKARAECLIPSCTVGWVQRPERIIIVCAGAILGFLKMALGVLVILTWVTVGQRVVFTYRQIEAQKTTGLK